MQIGESFKRAWLGIRAHRIVSGLAALGFFGVVGSLSNIQTLRDFAYEIIALALGKNWTFAMLFAHPAFKGACTAGVVFYLYWIGNKSLERENI